MRNLADLSEEEVVLQRAKAHEYYMKKRPTDLTEEQKEDKRVKAHERYMKRKHAIMSEEQKEDKRVRGQKASIKYYMKCRPDPELSHAAREYHREYYANLNDTTKQKLQARCRRYHMNPENKIKINARKRARREIVRTVIKLFDTTTFDPNPYSAAPLPEVSVEIAQLLVPPNVSIFDI